MPIPNSRIIHSRWIRSIQPSHFPALVRIYAVVATQNEVGEEINQYAERDISPVYAYIEPTASTPGVRIIPRADEIVTKSEYSLMFDRLVALDSTNILEFYETSFDLVDFGTDSTSSLTVATVIHRGA